MSSIRLADETKLKLKISLRLLGCPVAGRHDKRLKMFILCISAELWPTVGLYVSVASYRSRRNSPSMGKMIRAQIKKQTKGLSILYVKLASMNNMT